MERTNNIANMHQVVLLNRNSRLFLRRYTRLPTKANSIKRLKVTV